MPRAKVIPIETLELINKHVDKATAKNTRETLARVYSIIKVHQEFAKGHPHPLRKTVVELLRTIVSEIKAPF